MNSSGILDHLHRSVPIFIPDANVLKTPYLLLLYKLSRQAILKGFWIVFEDLDKAPNDIQSTLLPLLEGSNSFVTGHGEVISSLFIV